MIRTKQLYRTPTAFYLLGKREWQVPRGYKDLQKIFIIIQQVYIIWHEPYFHKQFFISCQNLFHANYLMVRNYVITLFYIA